MVGGDRTDRPMADRSTENWTLVVEKQPPPQTPSGVKAARWVDHEGIADGNCRESSVSTCFIRNIHLGVAVVDFLFWKLWILGCSCHSFLGIRFSWLCYSAHLECFGGDLHKGLIQTIFFWHFLSPVNRQIFLILRTGHFLSFFSHWHYYSNHDRRFGCGSSENDRQAIWGCLHFDWW